MHYKLKAQFETGTTCTGHSVQDGCVYVESERDVLRLTKPPHNFVLLGRVVPAEDPVAEVSQGEESINAGDTAAAAIDPTIASFVANKVNSKAKRTKK
jgi:hypothetical protein